MAKVISNLAIKRKNRKNAIPLEVLKEFLDCKMHVNPIKFDW